MARTRPSRGVQGHCGSCGATVKRVSKGSSTVWVHSTTGKPNGAGGHDVNDHLLRDAPPVAAPAPSS